MPIERHGFLGRDASSYRENIIRKYEEYFSFAHQINILANEIVQNLQIDSDNGQELIGIALFTRIHESFQSSFILLSLGIITDAECIIRCMLEALYWLKFIKSEPENVSLYMRSSRVNELKSVHSLIEQGYEHNYSDERMAEMREEYISLKESSKKVNDIAELSNMKSWHSTIYLNLSNSIHTHPRKLEDRYLKVINNECKEVVCGPNDNIELARVLMLGVEMLSISLLHINEIFGLGKEEQINSTYTQYAKLSDRAWKRA